MSDLADFFRWQWLWRSRRRLFAIGLVVFLLGVALLVLLVCTWVWGENSRVVRGLPLPILLIAAGGYGMLQAVLSGGGAFGDHDHDDSREHRRRAWRYRRAEPDDAGPIPLSSDTAEAVPLATTCCPACEGAVSESSTECPICFQRLVPK